MCLKSSTWTKSSGAQSKHLRGTTFGLNFFFGRKAQGYRLLCGFMHSFARFPSRFLGRGALLRGALSKDPIMYSLRYCSRISQYDIPRSSLSCPGRTTTPKPRNSNPKPLNPKSVQHLCVPISRVQGLCVNPYALSSNLEPSPSNPRSLSKP